MLRRRAQGLHDADVPYGAVNFVPLIREGDFRVEMTRYIGSENSAEDYTKGTIECRRQCQEVLQYLKEHWIGFEDAYIIDTAPTLGSLAQPALVGEKKMTQEMILKREMPDDRIAITAYGIDLHSPEMGGQNFLYYLTPGEYYGVPFGVSFRNRLLRIFWSAENAFPPSGTRSAPSAAPPFPWRPAKPQARPARSASARV